MSASARTWSGHCQRGTRSGARRARRAASPAAAGTGTALLAGPAVRRDRTGHGGLRRNGEGRSEPGHWRPSPQAGRDAVMTGIEDALRAELAREAASLGFAPREEAWTAIEQRAKAGGGGRIRRGPGTGHDSGIG